MSHPPVQPPTIAYQSPGVVETNDARENARLSVVNGVVSLLTFWIPAIGLVPALLAILPGIDAWRHAASAGTRRLAVTGTVMGVAAVAAQAVVWWLFLDFRLRL
jgi:hypothetical protein